MVSMQPFNTQFTLSREYLSECFDQSLPHGKSARPNYIFPALLFAAGAVILFYTDKPKIVGSMFIALAVLELIHIRFRRAWWLARQTWGKSADSLVKLTIDEDGIQTRNSDTKSTLLWADIESVIETDLGLILVTNSGDQQYLSKSLFSAELISKIIARNKDENFRHP